MESNGKRVDLAGRPLVWQTAPVVWGQPGTNGQHAFYQALHQGTEPAPAEMIGFWQPVEDLGNHHDLLVANMSAQIPHLVCLGNRPATLIILDRLTPGCGTRRCRRAVRTSWRLRPATCAWPTTI
jgi:glucose-6-phosphate isomerase